MRIASVACGSWTKPKRFIRASEKPAQEKLRRNAANPSRSAGRSSAGPRSAVRVGGRYRRSAGRRSAGRQGTSGAGVRRKPGLGPDPDLVARDMWLCRRLGTRPRYASRSAGCGDFDPAGRAARYGPRTTDYGPRTADAWSTCPAPVTGCMSTSVAGYHPSSIRPRGFAPSRTSASTVRTPSVGSGSGLRARPRNGPCRSASG